MGPIFGIKIKMVIFLSTKEAALLEASFIFPLGTVDEIVYLSLHGLFDTAFASLVTVCAIPSARDATGREQTGANRSRFVVRGTNMKE